NIVPSKNVGPITRYPLNSNILVMESGFKSYVMQIKPCHAYNMRRKFNTHKGLAYICSDEIHVAHYIAHHGECYTLGALKLGKNLYNNEHVAIKM
ncbi:hypothetical protein L9F63_015013, partial [Diploptera punctata]